MFLTYLRRELSNRRKHTAIIAAGLALAIALVVVVSSFSRGVKDAQADALASVYGVGTDITITATPAGPTQDGGAAGGGRPNFRFGADGAQPGAASGDPTTLSQSRLTIERGTTALPESTLTAVLDTAGVSDATGILQLQNIDFSGTIAQAPSGTTAPSGNGGPPTGGQGGQGGGGFGGGDFSVSQTTVQGIPVTGDLVGPLTNTSTVAGRTFVDSDAGTDNVVLDQTYATSESTAVGETITLGGTAFTVIGIVGATGSASTTPANAYIPLDTAQTLYLATLSAEQQSDPANGQVVTTIYVAAASSDDVGSLQQELQSQLPDATVSTEADLASSISGSLSTASDLIANLGRWLSTAVLAAAFLIAILFTLSGVSRRTREFGTLKAIGWSNGRITRQVAGESIVQGLIGGALGAGLGLIAILIINLVAPTISGSISSGTAAAGPPSGGPGGGPGGEGGGFPGAGRAAASTATDAVLHLPVLVPILVLGIGLAIAGGLLAGAFGGWRASRLRPAEALRSAA